MTDAQKYLKQVKLYDMHINNKLEELDRLNALALKVTTSLSLAPAHGSGNQDKLGDAVAKVIDLRNEVNRDIDHFVGLKQEAKAVVDKITDPNQFNILYRHYFLYETLEQIACEMPMAYRNVTRIHGRALQAIEELLKEGALQ